MKKDVRHFIDLSEIPSDTLKAILTKAHTLKETEILATADFVRSFASHGI